MLPHLPPLTMLAASVPMSCLLCDHRGTSRLCSWLGPKLQCVSVPFLLPSDQRCSAVLSPSCIIACFLSTGLFHPHIKYHDFSYLKNKELWIPYPSPALSFFPLVSVGCFERVVSNSLFAVSLEQLRLDFCPQYFTQTTVTEVTSDLLFAKCSGQFLVLILRDFIVACKIAGHSLFFEILSSLPSRMLPLMVLLFPC